LFYTICLDNNFNEGILDKIPLYPLICQADEKSFYHEPFSDYKRYPYYYLGDLAEKLRKQGHDIQCHSFSHPYISMETLNNIRIDLEDWQITAKREGFARSNIFAFPFLGDYHYTDKSSGIKTIPAFRNPDKMYNVFGFKYHIDLSTRPKNSMGTEEQ